MSSRLGITSIRGQRHAGAARYTIQLASDMCASAFRSCHPVMHGERRIVAHVLLVAAFEVSNPIQVSV